jgi:hypothetical protein
MGKNRKKEQITLLLTPATLGMISIYTYRHHDPCKDGDGDLWRAPIRAYGRAQSRACRRVPILSQVPIAQMPIA